MALPRVVIVGRPNVGKSSLFNWLARKRIAITDAQAGVTRDRLTYVFPLEDRWCELVDTGGIGHIDEDNLTQEIERQIRLAIDSADLILFVLDTREGLTAIDQEIDRRLRSVAAPTIVVANKCDSEKIDMLADDFFRLGRTPLIKVSVQNQRGQRELLKAIRKKLPEAAGDERPLVEPTMKLAIVGRRNVGKSTFINALAQEERMIVSEVAGTTRDSVDVRFELDGQAFLAIDTPGLRRRKSVNSNIDWYGVHRAQRSIRRADVVLLFFDSREEISRTEKQLAGYIEENFKPCIFVVNKWDLCADEIPTQNWAEYVRHNFPSLWNAPIAFITGKTGKNVKTLVNHAQMLFKQAQSRLDTGELNRLIKSALQRNTPPLVKGKRGKVFFATQVDVEPPTFALMCNHPSCFTDGYRRYLMGVFRDQLSFGEVPIKVYYRRRSESTGKSTAPEVEDETHEPTEEQYREWERLERRRIAEGRSQMRLQDEEPPVDVYDDGPDEVEVEEEEYVEEVAFGSAADPLDDEPPGEEDPVGDEPEADTQHAPEATPREPKADAPHGAAESKS